MAKNFEHLIHKHSSQVTEGTPKLPTTSQIEYGELAINYAQNHEKIAIKNSNNQIVTFSPDSNFVEKQEFEKVEHVIASSLTDIDDRIEDIKSTSIKGITMNGVSKGTSGVIDLGTVITSHQSIKTINSTSLVGSGNLTIDGLPTVSSTDNGKILMVVNGVWSLVSPTMIYSGSGTPDSSQGNNGDIYLQTS